MKRNIKKQVWLNRKEAKMLRKKSKKACLTEAALIEELLSSPVVHADETPVMVTKDGREGMHKNIQNAKKIEEYIRTQLQEDIAEDQISFKEYIDPFTGKKK